MLFKEVQPTHLLHFAWFVQPEEYWNSMENIRWARASMDLITNFYGNGGTRAVFAGTCAEYDWHYGMCKENLTPLAPSSLYGACKHSLHLVLDSVSENYHRSSAWGRIFHVYGPCEHEKRTIPSIIRSLLRKEKVTCSNGETIRDFLHVSDVASAFVALLNSSTSGAVNIASGMPYRMKDIYTLIGVEMNASRLLELETTQNPCTEYPVLLAHTGRLTGEVAWKPQYDMDAGLVQTIEWWRSSFKKHDH